MTEIKDDDLGDFVDESARQAISGTPAIERLSTREIVHRVKPYGRWANRVQYDPDAGTRAADYMVSAPEYAKRFVIAANPDDPKLEVTIPGQQTFRAVECEGVVLQPIQESRRWKPIPIKNKAELQAFHESADGKQKRMMEQFGLDFSGDDPMGGSQDATRLIDTEFVPIMAGPFFKQLYIYDYLLMHARAFEMTNHSALAAGAIKIMQRFVLGRGVNFNIKHDKAKAEWDEFWVRNKMRDKIRLMARDLPWQGELMLRFFERAKGYVRLTVLDPSTCWEVVTDPEDIEHVFYYHFQYPTPYQLWVSGQIPVAKYIIQQVPPTNILHLKINVSSQEKRGRSDLLAAMPWIKRFNDFYNGQTIKAVLEANLVFKIKIKGDQADVDAFLSNAALTELPPPGGTWIENEAVELQATSAQLTAGRGASGIGQQIGNIVAASLNLPGEYFNIESTGPARATALVKTDPAVKTIEDRQQLLQETIEAVYDYVMADALAAGRLDRGAIKHDPERVDDPSQVEDDDDEATPGRRTVLLRPARR